MHKNLYSKIHKRGGETDAPGQEYKTRRSRVPWVPQFHLTRPSNLSH